MKHVCREFLAIVLAFCVVSASSTASAGERPVEVPCVAHLDMVGGGQYLPHFYRLTPPSDAKPPLNAALKPTVDSFFIAPVSTQEYAHVFGSKSNEQGEVTQAQTTEIKKIQKTLNVDFGLDAGSRELNSNNYKSVINASKASFILVVGHNDNGTFHFLDGSTTFLDSLVTATRPDQRMILLSCRAESMLSPESASKAAATRNDLTYEQAFEITKTIQQFIASAGPQVSLAMISQALKTAEAKSAFNYVVGTFVTKAACGVAAGAAIIVIALIISGGVPCLKKDDCQ